MSGGQRFRLHIILLAAAAVVFSGFDAAAQCAMCKAVIESSVDGTPGPGSGINEGILYIMGIPYLLIGTVGFLIYRHKKKQQRALTEGS